MSSLIESYNAILQKASLIDDRARKAQQKIAELKETRKSDIPARIAKLEEQLVTIDEYMLKLESFRLLAERYMDSQNVQTIEAPPGYRVNLNRLRQWTMMIDPASDNDPYAQRVYVVAQCDQCFLTKKKEEFTRRIEQLKQDADTGMDAELRRLEEELAQCALDSRTLASDQEMSLFASAVTEANQLYWYETPPSSYANAGTPFPVLSPGAYALPLPIPQEQRPLMRSLFGKFYDQAGSRVLLPVELETSQEFAMSVLCAPSRAKQLDRALQNLLLGIIEGYPAGKNKIYVLDAVRYSSAALGTLKQLEDSFAIAPIPRNPEQLTATLEELISTFSDLDDMLELCDSVAEYNSKAGPDQQLRRTTVVLFGWPNSFEGKNREYLQRIMTSYERYGVSFVSVSYRSGSKQGESPLPEYAAQNAIQIKMLPKESSIRFGEEGAAQGFTWYTMTEALPPQYAASLLAHRVERAKGVTVYPERYDCVTLPEYTRAYQKIELPFGVDGKGAVHSVSFEHENFAAYLVGASRSGKSTLLHTLIAGLIRGYHPDNVELWLADFKQLEFKKYIDHCPPHVKYVLLDESTELVYDLIDKLTDKMMERQRIFARLGKERIDQIDPAELREPMPVIFVILDEFSIMSQAIAESQAYRLRLQNLLAKGAALGIKFLFSSQTFTTGVAGLTPTARAQIQQRIAMKGTKEEISETLELSANLKTEQVRNWMDALPPHYALVKYRVSADQLPQVMRVEVMYFPTYDVRDRLVERINQSMTAVEEYQPGSIQTYVDKHPVLVDGNTYEAFPEGALREELPEGGEEILASFGTPRLMSRLKPVWLTPETRENILLIGRAMEQVCAASIVTSVMRAFLMQNRPVQVWAYGKNNLYRLGKDGPWQDGLFDGVAYSEGLDQVCGAIRAARDSLERREASGQLIVLLGIDRICADFDFVEGAPKQDLAAADGSTAAEAAAQRSEEHRREREQALKASGAAAVSPQDLMRNLFAARWPACKARAEADARAEGRNEEEISAAVKAARGELAKAIQAEVLAAQQEPAEPEIPAPEQEPVQESKQEPAPAGGAYHALADLQYIVKQGSRMGCHFLLALNNYADLKSTGLRLDWFRHRLAFQLPAEDSRTLFGSRVASAIPERICQYSDQLTQFSFRPYLHPGLGWDGWTVDENGKAVDPAAFAG